MENINGSNATQNEDIFCGEFYAKFSKNFRTFTKYNGRKKFLKLANIILH